MQESNDRFGRVNFLPLQSFDPVDCDCWASLAHKVEDWLTTVVVDTQTQEWAWGCELFWMAFVAAYPKFPQLPWPNWDPRIPIDGAFIQGRLQRVTGCGVEALDPEIVNEDVAVLRRDIWEQFRQSVCIYYPGEMILSRGT